MKRRQWAFRVEPVHCANANPCSDGRSCSYCYADARNVNDNTAIRWSAFWS
jgi:hypothetical protein